MTLITATMKNSTPVAVGESTRIVDQRGRALRNLRISVTDRCNFRCGYCMPKDVFGRNYRFLPKSQLLSYTDLERLVRAFVHLGVHKVRLSGGEPLLRHDLEDLVRRLARLEGLDDLAVTTNASLLTESRIASLQQAGLRRVNISLDALDEKIYHQINQINSPLQDILRGIDLALSAGFDSVKINMVVQKGINVSEIIPMARYFRGTKAILRFIEFMDVGNHNQWEMQKVFTAQEIIDLINPLYPLEPLDANYYGEVAKRWQYVDGKGEIGVISSITQPFCGGCVRARLSAVGELYTCLFANTGADLRQFLKSSPSDATLAAQISALWKNRHDQYSVERLLNQPQATNDTHRNHTQKVEMSYIGG